MDLASKGEVNPVIRWTEYNCEMADAAKALRIIAPRIRDIVLSPIRAWYTMLTSFQQFPQTWAWIQTPTKKLRWAVASKNGGG